MERGGETKKDPLMDVPMDIQEIIMEKMSRVRSGPSDKDRRYGKEIMDLKRSLQAHGINLGQCLALEKKFEQQHGDNIGIQLKDILGDT